ncbi:hypothetical protein D9758_005097 [Tetrapyrgos nigripes]|uniref:Uncharacterized protein n=1 Tax=Tetrapyrgos nigripes TaxID=182062 RepID=A0A8H5GVM0_9AGAR|nr:hypothetical protein D9758_005097 [Tetrapyrgos nigripes]
MYRALSYSSSNDDSLLLKAWRKLKNIPFYDFHGQSYENSKTLKTLDSRLSRPRRLDYAEIYGGSPEHDQSVVVLATLKDPKKIAVLCIFTHGHLKAVTEAYWHQTLDLRNPVPSEWRVITRLRIKSNVGGLDLYQDLDVMK